MSSSSYESYILDTGDYNILAFEKKEFGKDVVQTAISLYEQMDITINLIKLDISVSNEIKDFIKSICGRLIPYNNSAIVVGSKTTYTNDYGYDMGSIVDKLKFDLKQIISFYKIKSFWSSYSKDAFDLDNVVLNTEKTLAPVSDVDGHDESAIEYGLVSDAFDSKVLPKDWLSGYRVVKTSDISLNTISSKRDKISTDDMIPYSYIIFNSVYNVSLFVRDNPSIKYVCDEFPEFEIIEIIDTTKIDSKGIENILSFFNKKTFLTKQNLIDKIESFNKLYDLKSKKNSSLCEELTEKDKVFRFMNNMYIINDDVGNKVGASDLYNTVMNHLCISFSEKTAFRKRLAGYFIELGLTRKRYTDGYSYYGVKLRYGDNKKTGNISVEDIMKKRLEEKKEWITPTTTAIISVAPE